MSLTTTAVEVRILPRAWAGLLWYPQLSVWPCRVTQIATHLMLSVSCGLPGATEQNVCILPGCRAQNAPWCNAVSAVRLRRKSADKKQVRAATANMAGGRFHGRFTIAGDMASNVGHECSGRLNVSTCQPRFWWCSCWSGFGGRQHVLLAVGDLQCKQLSSDGDADTDLFLLLFAAARHCGVRAGLACPG